MVETTEIRSNGCCSVASFKKPVVLSPKTQKANSLFHTPFQSHRYATNTLNISQVYNDGSLPVTPIKSSLNNSLKLKKIPETYCRKRLVEVVLKNPVLKTKIKSN